MTQTTTEDLNETPEATIPPAPALPTWYVRSLALGGLAGCLVILGIAVYLTPSKDGFGTHRALPLMNKCGFLVWTGYPCPTCGMTTAFAHTVRGQWISAFNAQPAGFLFALGTVVGAAYCLVTTVRGTAPNWLPRWLPAHRFFLLMLVIMFAGWGYKLIAGVLSGQFPVN